MFNEIKEKCGTVDQARHQMEQPRSRGDVAGSQSAKAPQLQQPKSRGNVAGSQSAKAPQLEQPKSRGDVAGSQSVKAPQLEQPKSRGDVAGSLTQSVKAPQLEQPKSRGDVAGSQSVTKPQSRGRKPLTEEQKANARKIKMINNYNRGADYFNNLFQEQREQMDNFRKNNDASSSVLKPDQASRSKTLPGKPAAQQQSADSGSEGGRIDAASMKKKRDLELDMRVAQLGQPSRKLRTS